MINKTQNENESIDEEPGKLFVGGLSWETTEGKLLQYFSTFGEVLDSVVMKNNDSGQSRGFGFVTFTDPKCVETVLAKGPHLLDGRAIDPKPCSTKAAIKSKKNSQYPKIFLGGLPFNVTETDLRQQFSKYGEVMDVIIMYDHEKNKCRGFGFLSFEKDEDVNKCVADHYIYVNGKKVEVKRAEPRDGRSNASNQWPNAGNSGAMESARNQTMPGYQGWGAAPTAGYGYGAPPNTPVPYGGWSGPPAQWGPGYPPAGYPPFGGPQPPYSGWNWNIPPQPPAGPAGPPPSVGGPTAGGGPPTGGVPASGMPPSTSGPPIASNSVPPVIPGVPNMNTSSNGDGLMKQPQYSNYGFGGYASMPPNNYNAGMNRPYSNEASASVSNAESYGGAPGPQRNNQGPQGYHPYRRA